MSFPISQDDFVVIETENEYILYRIHNICVVETNNDPNCITREKRDDVCKKLRITCTGKDDTIYELLHDNENYYLNGDMVFFIRSSIINLIDEYLILEEYDPREKLDFSELTSEEMKLSELFDNDDYWATRFWNDFLNIEKIGIIINTKPVNMTWRQFYINLINKIDTNGRLARLNPTKKSIFSPLFSVLGL